MTALTRRDLIATSVCAGSVTLAGCGGDSTTRYQLSAGTVPGSLAERFRWTPRDPEATADRAVLERLVEDGSLTTAGFVVLEPDSRRYLEHDGGFYAVTAEESGTVEREHWIFWFDLLEGAPPADAEVFTSSLGTGGGTDLQQRYDLSEQDARVVEDAAGEIVREFDLHDPEVDPPGHRGHVFLRRAESETALLPEAPFTHVAFEVNDETHYARAVTERASVELQQYSYRSEHVADSATAYAEYVRERHLETTFDGSAISSDVLDVLETITRGGGRYEEHVPLSEAMQTVLDRLGLDAVETPEPKGVSFSDPAYFAYGGRNFQAELQIFR